MKILHTIKSYSPISGGMYEVVRQISKQLANLGHDITIATSKLSESCSQISKNISIKEFDISGDYTNGPKGDVLKYQEFLINSNFDIITNFAAQQPLTDAMLPILNKIKAKKIFVPTGFNALCSKTHAEYFENMKRWMKEYDLNIFLSNNYQDINFARKNNVPENKMTIITNGASREEFFGNNLLNIRNKIGISKSNFLILHVGSFTGVKGHYEAIKIFLNAKIKDSTLLLIGNGNTACSKKVRNIGNKFNKSISFRRQNKKIIIPNFTRSETVSAYKEANIFLFPSNTECSPIVLFEAMAAKLPFLTTDVGNAKEIIQWSKGGILLPTKHNVMLGENILEKSKKILKKTLQKIGLNFWNPCMQYSKADINASVKILEKIYLDPQKRKKLSDNGKKSWIENFTWEKISKRYEVEYKKLLNK